MILGKFPNGAVIVSRGTPGIHNRTPAEVNYAWAVFNPEGKIIDRGFTKHRPSKRVSRYFRHLPLGDLTPEAIARYQNRFEVVKVVRIDEKKAARVG